jgi:ankyrin repeat protein
MDINTQLFDYISKQDWDSMKKLIQDSDEVDLNIRDESNNYLIQYIIIYNKVDLIDIFIEKKCKIDIIDNDGKCLLFYAIKYNYSKLVEKLLDINYIGFPIAELKDKNKNYPIHYAIMYNNKNIIELLLTKDININIKDGNGNTPLMISIKTKNSIIINYLLSNENININSINNIGETALHIACNNEKENIVELLLKNKDININIQDLENKYTPLMYAVSLNNFNITNVLLSNSSINILLQDVTGSTAYHHAIIQDANEDIIKL